jgi:hypothetical protein
MRGSAGLEYWWDWIRLSANYYTPLSSWKPSKDLDGSGIMFQERPAQGWDARATGYLPFYRNLSLSAAIERWRGEHVAATGSAGSLSRNPSVAVFGLGWTPIPIMTFAAETRNVQGKNDTSISLAINYRFGVPVSEQLFHDDVEEMRTVAGSRHDFVSRQNEMILDYRATPGAYIIKCTKVAGTTNTYQIQIFDGWGNPVKGESVRLMTKA